jgi:hypothetical protein
MEAEIGKILGMDLDVERKSWILAGTARHVFGSAIQIVENALGDGEATDGKKA